jgi:V8-like Glu-specific endopeptidase
MTLLGVFMKKTIFAALCLLTVNSQAVMKVIYGEDNRIEARNHPNAQLRDMAKSVAGRVSEYGLYDIGDEFGFSKRTLRDRMNVCSEERFANQYSVSDCTGFLVGKDILVTAGHCMQSEYDCSAYKWVFDYEDTSESFNKNNVYGCKEIVDQAAKYNILGYANDFAVVKLDREVKGRTPLKFRTKGKIKKSSKIAVIGHPSGLPVKIADDARVKNTFGLTFKADLDTYGGNSGSPVINLKSMEVEGILIQGKEDYVLADHSYCMISNKAKGKGEKVFKINKIKSLKKMKKEGKL